MSTPAADISRRENHSRERLPRAPRAWSRSIQFFAEAFLELFGLVWLIFAFSLVSIGVGIWILPGALEFATANAERSRALAQRLAGATVDAYHRPVTGPAGPGQARHTVQRLRDPVVQRDLLWNLLNPWVGIFLGILSPGLVLTGAWESVAMPFQLAFPSFKPATWFTITGVLGLPLPAKIGLSILLIAVEIVIGIVLARPLLRAQGAWARLVLHVQDADQWRRRADLLEAARADALDFQHAELQRIERDLHDGAQMRFVSTGLNVAEAARLIYDDPERASELLNQAKDESAAGLAELRRLVRGIRPPVLADRGLVDAVRSLAKDTAVPAVVTSTLSGRLAAPLESALYFATVEVLTNAAKHAQASRIEVDISESGGFVILAITDNGRGGARADRDQGGLTGVRRRLNAFDGTLEVSSPDGGPTVITITAPRVGPTPSATAHSR